MLRMAHQMISSVVAVWVFRLIPSIVTAAIFLVLYNNTLQGRAIIIGLIVLHAAFLLRLAGGRRHEWLMSSIGVGSLCSLAALGTVLALELSFPIAMPGEYARIRDLSKGLRSSSVADRKVFTVVFGARSRPRTVLAAYRSGDARETASRWRVPGDDWEYYGYEPNEGFSYINIVRWNGHGYFDRDYSYAKPPGVFRIVFIGDSYVEARQVPIHRTFHKQLESSLNRTGTGASDTAEVFQVIALGNSGTGQKSHLRVLQEQALRYTPDLVVVGVCGNDFCDDSPRLSRERNIATGAVTRTLRGLVRHDLYAAAFAVRRWEQYQRSRLRVSPEVLQWSAKPIARVEEAWSDSLRALEKSREICRDHRIGFAVMYVGAEVEVRHKLHPRETLAALDRIPGIGPDFRWDVEKTVKRIREFCSFQDIPFVSLVEPLADGQKRTGMRVFSDHYTMFGHLVVADALKKALEPRLPQRKAFRVSHTR